MKGVDRKVIRTSVRIEVGTIFVICDLKKLGKSADKTKSNWDQNRSRAHRALQKNEKKRYTIVLVSGVKKNFFLSIVFHVS